jgi:hypothetical protein
MAILDDSLRRRLGIPATFAHLIFNCFDLFDQAAKDIDKHWAITSAEAYGIGVRSTPSLIGNLLAAQDCVQRFGVEVVSSVPGFYSFTRTGSICVCLEWNDFCVCDLPCWRLDLDSFPRGLIIPQRNSHGHFTSLRIFRHAQDQRPFTLRVRSETAA